jgi:hypothetical protein
LIGGGLQQHMHMTLYYQNGEHAVGPFDYEVLARLKDAGVINGATPVRESAAEDWQPFAALNVENEPIVIAPDHATPSGTHYFYLDQNRQPVGPVGVETLRDLHGRTTISASTLVAAEGAAQWTPVADLLGLPASVIPTPAPRPTQQVVDAPVYRGQSQFFLLMGASLSLAAFYLVPTYSRDLKAITGRQRMEFTTLLILGIVTFGLLLAVIMTLYAYDLEKHGRTRAAANRQESLGTYVLIMNVVSFVVALFSGGLALVASAVIGSVAVWMIQKEINLYAVRVSN